MTRVLLIVDDAHCGGTFKVAERLAEGLAPRFALSLACCFTEVNAAARRRLADLGVVVLRHRHDSGHPSRSTHDRLGADVLITAAAPDVVLFCDSTLWSSLAAKAVVRERGLPHAAIVNLFEAEPPDALRRWDDLALRAAAEADAVVFVSRSNLDRFRARFPDTAIRARVVPNGLPDVYFREPAPGARDALRRDLGVDRDATMLLHVARLEGRKGQMPALEAFERSRRRSDAAAMRLFFVGFGLDHEIEAFRREIETRGLASSVRHLGVREDVVDLLDAGDLVLFPTRGEGDPLVTKEAMARGRPVIASDLPEIRDQGHPATLLVTPPGDDPERTVEELAAAIDVLGRDPERRNAIGRDLRRTAEARFRIADMIGAYAELIDEISAAPRRPSGCDTVAVPAVRLGRRLNIADPSEAWLALHEGWAELEAEGAWSLGDVSTLVLRTERRIRAVRITFDLQGLAVPGRPRVIDVSVDGVAAGIWRIGSGRRTRRSVVVEFRVPKRCFVVRLRHRGVVTPRELGLGADDRRLALFVSAVTVSEPFSAMLRDRLGDLPPWRWGRRRPPHG